MWELTGYQRPWGYRFKGHVNVRDPTLTGIFGIYAPGVGDCPEQSSYPGHLLPRICCDLCLGFYFFSDLLSLWRITNKWTLRHSIYPQTIYFGAVRIKPTDDENIATDSGPFNTISGHLGFLVPDATIRSDTILRFHDKRFLNHGHGVLDAAQLMATHVSGTFVQ
ncbi:hypothetical protein BDQ17DRAFT_1321342 [Cyathus striatus]|nr:hypothetical protein BDQ17DRAFT_1321342 [Cyathus striatus]